MKEREDIRSTEDMARFLSDMFFWLSSFKKTNNVSKQNAKTST